MLKSLLLHHWLFIYRWIHLQSANVPNILIEDSRIILLQFHSFPSHFPLISSFGFETTFDFIFWHLLLGWVLHILEPSNYSPLSSSHFHDLGALLLVIDKLSSCFDPQTHASILSISSFSNKRVTNFPTIQA